MIPLEQIKSELRPIRSEATYREYLGIIDELVDCAKNSPEEEVLELVSILTENYEAKHYPIEAPDPLEAIKINGGAGFEAEGHDRLFRQRQQSIGSA